MLTSLRRVLVASCLLLLAGSAAAQDETLNNVWFKLKLKVRGEAAVPGEEKPHKASVSLTAYLHLTLAPPVESGTEGGPSYPTTSYSWEILTETAPDTWTITDSGTNDLETADPTVFYLGDFGLDVEGLDGVAINCYQTIAIRAKLDAKGALKSATLKSLGGEVYDGSTNGDDALRGGITTTGKTVDEDDLPFGLG